MSGEAALGVVGLSVRPAPLICTADFPSVVAGGMVVGVDRPLPLGPVTTAKAADVRLATDADRTMVALAGVLGEVLFELVSKGFLRDAMFRGAVAGPVDKTGGEARGPNGVRVVTGLSGSRGEMGDMREKSVSCREPEEPGGWL